ncbi:MAG: TIGR00730 family Rossman fold protein [Actinomycetes bacterium]
MPTICVYCASSSGIDERYLALADQVGTAIARRGWQLVSGGGAVSMMGAVARAVRKAGGHTVGVIPQALIDMEVADHDSDELIITDDMRARKGIMDDRADAFLALPGGIGTLEELMEVWTARCLGMHDKPVVGLDPWGDFALLREQVGHWQQQGFVRHEAVAELVWTTEVEQALELIADKLAAAVRRPPSRGGIEA